ncbi:O-methyltransferase [uncultured Jannaschia sp.]|uniref:O-methyltransferase n=1 Tax=uncultured Jannaschia sp. TaxID=293347 RepID=UPI002619A0DB|nr:class I SAM-dependent methyltransferase [uncultured Jannaschia sp.]
MDSAMAEVLDEYHDLIRAERADRDEQSRAPRDRSSLHLAVGPQTGQLINILAASLPAPRILELGTSFGYSTLWLADAARSAGGRILTMELVPEKSARAAMMIGRAGLSEFVDFRVGDARELIAKVSGPVDFVLMDLWKDLYVPCLDLIHPRLAPGAVVVADNMLRPGGPLMQQYADAIRAKGDMESILVPVGTGLEISRFKPG